MMNYERFRRYCAGGLLGVLLMFSTAVGQDKPAPLTESKRLVDAPDERVTVLSDGLTLMLKAHRAAPVVSVRMYCKTGSIYEQEYLGAGMSHLFEHLLHGAETTTRTEEESRRILDEIGGNTNAYTSLSMTCYYINTLTEHMETAINLLGDWLTHPTFPEAAFVREREVVQRELERHADDPDRQLWYTTQETMFRGHPARFPIIGYQAVVQQLSNQDIINYYRRMYTPDNMIVCIAGDIDFDEAQDAVCRAFADFRRKRLPTISLPAVEDITAPITVTREMETEAALMRMAWPSIPLTDPDLYALDVLSYVLTQGESSLLVRTVRDKGLVFGIDSSSWTPDWGRGTFMLTARLEPDNIDKAKSAILEQIDRLREDLVSEEVLEQAKRQKAAEHVFGMQTAESVAERMVWDFVGTGDTDFSRLYVDKIQSVTPEQIREMVRKYLDPQKLATILVLPEGQREQVVEKEQAATGGEVRKVVLDNGLTALIRRNPAAPLVAIQLYSIGGVYAETEETNGLSQLAAMLAPRGTETRSAEEIARFFDARGGQFSGRSGNNTIYFQAEVLEKDFADAMDVFGDVVAHPTFPESELEVYRPRLVYAIKRINDAWRSELVDTFNEHYFVNSPYRFAPLGSVDVVSNASREQVASFYHRLVTGANSVVTVYGDIDPDKAESVLRRCFGELPDGQRIVREVPAEPNREEPKLFIKPKPESRRTAGIAIGMEGMKVTNTQDAPAMAVLDTIISGYRFPTGWLQEALRGGENSYVYEVHAVERPGLLPGCFMIYAGCEPDQVTTVHGIIMDKVNKARDGEFKQAELDRAITIIRTTNTMQHQTNSELAMQAGLDELYGLGYDYRERFLERVGDVTIDDVTRVAKTYFTKPVVVIVTSRPGDVNIGIEPIMVEDADTAESGPQN